MRNIRLALLVVAVIAGIGGLLYWCVRPNAEDLLKSGNAWREKKEYDKAIKDYDEAIRLNPKLTGPYCSRGNAWYGKKDYDKAIKDYDEVIRLDPDCVEAFVNRGAAWAGKKEYDKAIKDYDNAIRLDPNHAGAYSSRGYLYLKKREQDRALLDFDEAIRLQPASARAFYYRGVAWIEKKEYDKAFMDFDEAVRLDPKHTRARLERAATQMIVRQPKSASGFQTILDREGWKDALSPYAVLLGHLAARLDGDDDAAKRFLTDSAGKLAQDWPYPVVQFLRGELDESAVLDQATDNEKRTEAYCFLGLDHELKKNVDKARADFRWVKESGSRESVEYGIAVAELERMEGGKK